MMEPLTVHEQAILQAINRILQHGAIDGSHHKGWVIDQVLRILSGEAYPSLVDESWSKGLAP